MLETTSIRQRQRDSKTDHPHRGFNFTQRMAALCEHAVRQIPPLQHISMQNVAVGWAQTKKDTTYGLHASLTPLRFQGGELAGPVGQRRYAVQRMHGRGGVEYLYILTFYLPRFMDLTFTDKLTTIFHELWHISPDFDGDLRRHPGRCYAHTRSQKEYDREMESLARQWLASAPPPELYDFLYLDFASLFRASGPIFGTKFPRPKLIPTA